MEQVKFRASQLGKLMTDARTKTGLSETCKSALLEVYVQQKYKRYKEISNKYIEKGIAVENDESTFGAENVAQSCLRMK